MLGLGSILIGRVSIRIFPALRPILLAGLFSPLFALASFIRRKITYQLLKSDHLLTGKCFPVRVARRSLDFVREVRLMMALTAKFWRE
jgi:hypothetical protein